jgi:aminotransferase
MNRTLLKEIISQRVKAMVRPQSLKEDEQLHKGLPKGVDVLPLCGFPVLSSLPDHLLEAASKHARDNGVAPSRGLLELRQAVSQKVKTENEIEADPESEIVITAGAIQALAVVMLALLDSGDEVVIPSPAFFFAGVVQLAGGRPVYAPMQEKTGFRLDVNVIERVLTTKTKVLILNSPVNPTGYVASRDDIEAIARLAEERNLIIVSDESYESLVYDGAVHHSIASIEYVKEKVITIQSFSKSYGLPGWRMGFIVANNHLVEEFVKVFEYVSGFCNYLAQKVATAAIIGPQEWRQNFRHAYQNKRNLLVNGFSEAGTLSFSVPKGGPFFFLNIVETRLNCEAFSEYLLGKFGIPVTPGSAFQSDRHVRLPFGADDAVLEELIYRMGRALLPLG